MSRAIISPAQSPLAGTLHLPGDKSLSHRHALLSLFVNKDVTLQNFGTGEDCQTTLRCLQALGKRVTRKDAVTVISGRADSLSAELHCGNSGTTARLLMGILAGRSGEWELTGDASLSRRPMERVAIPLRLMGADIELTNGHLPVRISGRKLKGIDYESPLASAQVKSAVLFAGLSAKGVTRYREPSITRDHTERLLGIGLDYLDWVTVNPEHVAMTAERLSCCLPGDSSSAAFWIVAALMNPQSKITLPDLLANPLRMELIKLLREHGAVIHLGDVHESGCEGMATVQVSSSKLSPFTIRQPQTAKVMDELPALAVLATQIDGKCEFHQAGELRVKESDRLKLVTENLRRMKAQIDDWDDGFSVTGKSKLLGTEIETGGDHRIAMAFAVAGLAAGAQTVIDDAECVNVSYPAFWEHLEQLAPGSVTLL